MNELIRYSEAFKLHCVPLQGYSVGVTLRPDKAIV